jgi:phosphatidylethanolamine/phosphatidyl-N-methylethanolamine N-methyltransferase
MSHLELLDRREARHSGQVSGRGISPAHRLFFKESIRSIRPTASFFPSSRYLAEALLRPIDFRKARTIVELGPGTGAVTGEILKRLRPDGRLLAIDINPVFINHLRTACDDPRLTPVDGSATDLLSLLAMHEAGPIDAVVSSLGLTRMSNRLRLTIVRQINACLASRGTMTQYQYVRPYPGYFDIPKLRFCKFDEAQFLRNSFRDVSIRGVLFDLPPALVFTCRK